MERGARRIALAGSGELSEIALLAAYEEGVSAVAVADAQAKVGRCHGAHVVAELTDGGTFDGVVIIGAREPEKTWKNNSYAIKNGEYLFLFCSKLYQAWAI